jgi:hypothetical protein
MWQSGQDKLGSRSIRHCAYVLGSQANEGCSKTDAKRPVPITSAEGRSWGGASRLVLVSGRELFLHAHKQTAKGAISSWSGTMGLAIALLMLQGMVRLWCCACHTPQAEDTCHSASQLPARGRTSAALQTPKDSGMAPRAVWMSFAINAHSGTTTSGGPPDRISPNAAG